MEPRHVSLARRHLMAWSTGRRSLLPDGRAALSGTATVVLDDDALLADVVGSGLVGSGSLVFYPVDIGTSHAITPDEGPGTPLCLPFEGSLNEPAGEAAIGDEFFLQVQDYASSEFLSVFGPTSIRFFSAEDFDAYVQDAESAIEQGRFPHFVLDHNVLLNDAEALWDAALGDGPDLRLHVDAEGTVRLSPSGLPLGTLDDTAVELEESWVRHNRETGWHGAAALGQVVPPERARAAFQERPWLPRYRAVSEALRRLALQGRTDLRVSGFGHRLTATAGIEDRARQEAPVILWNAEEHFVCLPERRTFQVGRGFAARLECLLAHGDAPLAAAREGIPRTELEAVAEACARATQVGDGPVGEPAVPA